MENGLNGSDRAVMARETLQREERSGGAHKICMVGSRPRRIVWHVGGSIVEHDGMVTFSPSSLAERGDCPGICGSTGGIGVAAGAAYPDACSRIKRQAIAPRLAGKMLLVDHRQWLFPGDR